MAAESGEILSFDKQSQPSPLYDWQSILLYCCVSASATVSLLGSSAIIIVARRKLKRIGCINPVYQRLMCVVSAVDMFSTLTLLIAPWLLPKDTAGYIIAQGNDNSCTVLGTFTAIIGLAPCIAGCTLSLYFLLTTKYGWREQQVSRQLEIPAYVVGVLLNLLFILLGLLLDGGLMNQVPSAQMCSIMGEDTTITIVLWLFTGSAFAFTAVGMWVLDFTDLQRNPCAICARSVTDQVCFQVSP